MASNNQAANGHDDRVRQLLDPKSFLKGKGALSDKPRESAQVPSKPIKLTADVISNPRSSKNNTLNGPLTLTQKSYDPESLLNPKGSKNHLKANSPSPYMSTVTSRIDPSATLPHTMNGTVSNINCQPMAVDEKVLRKSLLEEFYGVEHRTEQPRKKQKPNTEDDSLKAARRSTFTHRSNGIVGDYMKPDPFTLPVATSTLVDLTNDANDDDDLQITGSREIIQEVCYGSVPAIVMAYTTPKPKAKSESMFNINNEWGVMKCTLSREGRPVDDTRIEVTDPSGKAFGRISPELAIVLAPAMDGLADIRTQGRLLNRKKKPNEWPHQPCSEQLKMNLNIYGRRGDADRIGKLFGQHNIWFRPPLAPDAGTSTCNPHAQRRTVIPQNRESGRRGTTSDSRTVEEATEAVSKLFDHFASDSAPLKSTEAPDTIVTPLLDHQKQALTFLLEHEKPREFGTEEADNTSLWRVEHKKSGRKIYQEVVSGITLDQEPEQVYGGLLADVMGLGKTLEALALIAASLEDAKQFGEEKPDRSKPDNALYIAHTRATLLVVPLSTIKNWEDQIADHVKPGTMERYVYHGPNRTENPFLLAQNDIVITTYGTIATEFSGKNSKQDTSPIGQLKWFRIILDEAHTIREPRSTQSQAMYSLWAQRRWCLTGTPIQNRIDDLGSLTRFLRLYPYDNAARFNQYIRLPAQAGDPSFLKVLRVFVDSFTLRRLKDRVDLPPRKDLVVTLVLSPEEKKLHDFFKEISHVQIEEIAKRRKGENGTRGGMHHILQGIMTLRLICAHGKELLKEKDLTRLKGISATDAIDIDDVQEAPSLSKRAAYDAFSLMAEASVDLCRQCDKQLTGDTPGMEVDDSRSGIRCHVLPCLDVVCDDCFGPYKASFDSRPDKELVTCPFCSMIIGSQYVPITALTADELETAPVDTPSAAEQIEVEPKYYGGPHTKTRALLTDLEEMKELSKPLVAQGEPPIKCVVFSEFTSHLDLIERALSDNGHTFVRIDGSMSLNKRKKVLDALSTDDNVTILLASIKAAGQGLNLVAASRAFVMEPMWNPAAEAQAVDRIYRIGQKRDVVVKRYQMGDSIEGKIVELQKKKQALADVSMNRNHKQLSKQEIREQHMNDIRALFK